MLPGQFTEALKRGNAYVDQMLDAVRRVPGVDGVAGVSGGLPLTGSSMPVRLQLARTDEQNDRNRDFGHHERIAQPLRAAARRRQSWRLAR